MDRSLREEIILTVEKSLLKSQAFGATIAIRIDDRVFLEAGIGHQDKERNIALSADASFYTYSISKISIATVFLYLVGEKILNLDTFVRDYSIDFPIDTTITLRQLLSHTSGLADYGNMPAYREAVKANPRDPQMKSLIRQVFDRGLLFKPSERWAYSNIGYLLIERIIEKTTGRSIPTLFNEIIFKPLSLKKTFLPKTLGDLQCLTAGYSNFFSDRELQDTSRSYHPAWIAHSVMISTASETAKILDALLYGKIIDRSLVAQMSYPIYNLGKYPLFENLGYGLGLFVDTESAYGKVRGHTGEGLGYSVAAFNFSQLASFSVTIVAMVNRDVQDYGLVLVYKIANIIDRNKR